MSTIDAVIIHPTGQTEKVTLDGDYKALQDVVGGYFELLFSATGETSLWMNEEGALMGLPLNRAATILLYRLNPVFRQQAVLLGTVVVTGGADNNGNTRSVGDEALTAMGELPFLFPDFV